MVRSRCSHPITPSPRNARILTASTAPHGVVTRSRGEVSRIAEANTPDTPTSTKLHRASAEKRRAARGSSSPSRCTTAPRVASPPTHSASGTRCSHIEDTARLWATAPCECPVNATGTRATAPSTAVHAAVVIPAVATANSETTAASTVAQK